MLALRVAIVHQVADGLQQVRLAQTDPTVDEQRVVGSAWVLGDLECRSARKLIGLARYEGVERKCGVEAAGFTHPWARFYRRRCGRSGCGGHRMGRRPLSELQRHRELALLVVLSKLFDDRKKTILDPLQDEPVGRLDHQIATGNTGLKRLNPGLELLVRQGLLEMLQAKSPEGVHSGERESTAEEPPEGETRIIAAAGRLIHSSEPKWQLTKRVHRACNSRLFSCLVDTQHEADLPTVEDPARAHPRIPGANENPRRP